jgi:hypothetical protein
MSTITLLTFYAVIYVYAFLGFRAALKIYIMQITFNNMNIHSFPRYVHALGSLQPLPSKLGCMMFAAIKPDVNMLIYTPLDIQKVTDKS